MDSRGYVALWRKFQDHEFWKERRVFSKAEAWIDMIWAARHQAEPTNVLIGMNTVECGYGQVVRSNVSWARRWGWSEHKVRRFIKLLRKLEMCVPESVGCTSRLTLCNYATYDPRRRECVEYLSNPCRGPVEHPSTKKNEKNEKNVKKTPLSPPVGGKRRFVPPSVDEVRAYCRERKSGVDPESFVAFYESKGWRVGNSPMKSWRAAVITWEKRQGPSAAANQDAQSTSPIYDEWTEDDA